MKKPIKVLLIEQNEDDVLLLIQELRSGGFDPASRRVDSRDTVTKALAEEEWDCVICDYSLPGFGGLAALAEVQSKDKDIPFILISGTPGEHLAVTAMKQGAHDYIMKDELGRLVPALERELTAAAARRDQQRTMDAREEFEQRFRKSFEYAPIGLALVALDGRWLQVNAALCRLVGYSEAELIGTTFQDITHSDDLAADLSYVRRLVSGEIQSYHLKKRYRHKKGRDIWVQLGVSLVRDPHNKPSYFVSQIQDITEGMAAERRIRLLAEALNSTRDCIVLTDLNRRILFVNPSVSESYGYSTEELIGEASSLLHSTRSSATLDLKRREETLSGGWRGDLIDRRKDGSEFPVELWTSSIRDEAGSPVAFIGVARDISSRVLAEEHLRESEEEFRLISENVADMIAVLTPDGKRIYNNPSYRNTLGEPRTIRGTDAFLEIHPDDRERVRQIFDETVRTGVGQRTEYRFLLKDGSVRDIKSQGSVITGEEGKVSKVVVVSRDVTEEKKVEQQSLRAQRMESIGTLAGGIAHDLNNVLAPIMMAIEVLQNKTPDPASRQILGIIETSAKRGAEIVSQVLAFGRGLKSDRILVQLRHVVNEVAKIAGGTFPKSIEVTTNVPRTLWTVSADPTQMHQVLLNMMVNARDAMPGGGILAISAENITLDDKDARAHLEAKPGLYVCLVITDTGTGISPYVREKMFEPFFTTKEIGKGTGLGLSTTLAIVKSHGGFITLDSEVGNGTTFRIYIPATGTTEGVAATGEESDLPMGNGQLILIIDDEAAIREITRETLQAYGYKVMTASDGAEGVALFAEKKKRIKLVITDIMMPVMDGTAAILALKKIKPDVKIIAASGLATRGQIKTPPDSNVKAFLTKPYTAEKLLTALAAALQ
jgi:PAS domain S-box-containing protein